MSDPKPGLKKRGVENMGRSESSDRSYVTVKSQISLIRMVAFGEIAFGIIILFGQTVAIAFSHEFATRSLTGIWTSWFFLMSAGICLFWSTRCTFNGLLAVLVMQIISATMGIPLFTSSCLLFGVYPFRWSLTPDGKGAALITSSIAILVTNLIMVLCSIVQLVLNGYNAYNCYFLAYGETTEEIYEYDEGKNSRNTSGTHTNNQNKSSSNSSQNPTSANANSGNAHEDDWGDGGGGSNAQYNSNYQQYNSGNDDDDWGAGPVNSNNGGNSSGNQNKGTSSGNQKQSTAQNPSGSASYTKTTQKVKIMPPTSKTLVKYDDPLMPQPPPDLTIAAADIIIIKYCGVTGVFMAFLIFCCQVLVTDFYSTLNNTALFALANEAGVNIGIGIWGALYYFVTGIITVYNGLKPTGQSSVSIFILQTIQFVISVPLVGISYYILAVFGSCTQEVPVPECPPDNITAGISLTCLGGVMALCGTIQGLTSLTLMLICSQTICGTTRCMISGSSVYPTL